MYNALWLLLIPAAIYIGIASLLIADLIASARDMKDSKRRKEVTKKLR